MGLFPQSAETCATFMYLWEEKTHSLLQQKQSPCFFLVIIFPEKKGMLGSAGIESFP